MSATAAPRTFTNTAGKEIVAEAVSHDGGGNVQLKRSDGLLFQMKVTDLSLEDQQYLLEWAKANPPKVDYRLEIKTSAEKVTGTNSRQFGGFKNVKNELWIYRVKLTNFGRQTVKGLKAEYRVFIIDAADGQYRNFDGITEGYLPGSIAIDKEMRYNESFEFSTNEIEIDKVTYDYSYSRDERYKDALRGIMVRIKDSAGKVVMDFVSPTATLKGKTWDSIPSSREIKRSE